MGEFTWGNVVTVGSVVVALVVFAAGYVERMRVEKRRSTITLLHSIYANSALEQARTRVARMIVERDSPSSSTISPEDDRAVTQILDFYEFLARLAICGHIDQRLVVDIRGGAMRATYTLLEEYIVERRQRLHRPKLYQFLEKFVRERLEGPSV